MTYKNSIPIIALALVAIPTTAMAQDPVAIEIRATSALAEWQHDTNRQLDAGLARAPSLRGGRANEAVVQVAFDVNGKGEAVNIRTLPGDFNPAAEQAALYAVRSLDTLDELPEMANGRSVLANIILANTPASRDRLADKLAKIEKKRLASSGAVASYVTIGAIPTLLAD
ncbi:hypothetical protein [Sphingomicrobium clamense]|uniref:TonB C-terminal domain-containing protein n=1 Tax=Sphingomicrobium clamense TaxID=2851013 RepID=A0ABS6V3P5_9SPHN|nr:hypothetical protein [Sphingomicrobium sp. B8]MBW0143708.1 hypothetical protein [Sphingomicrobium sp. B8]